MATTLANVVTRAQAALGDVSGDYWTQATLLPYINTAYRSLDRAFKVAGVRFTRGRTTINSYTAGLTVLDRTTTPALPTDFLQPYEIWEKSVGDPDTSYVLMTFVPDQLPDVVQGTSLNYFDWFQGSLYFVGATTARTLRIDYQRGITDLAVSGDTLVIDDALDPVAYVAAGEAALSVGQAALANSLLERGVSMIENLITQEIKTMQRIPRRRIAPTTSPRPTAL